LEDDVEEVLEEEREEKLLNNVERDVTKTENLMVHEDEIMSRPRRTWFENETEKQAAKDAGRRELNGQPDAVKVRGEKKKLSNKEKKRLDLKDERKDSRTWNKGKGDAEVVKKGGAKAMGKAKGKGDRKKGGKPAFKGRKR
jgi:ATP-dependent RNA helicase DDX27